MRLNFLLTLVLLLIFECANAFPIAILSDTVNVSREQEIDPEEVLDNLLTAKTNENPTEISSVKATETPSVFKLPENLPLVEIDSLLLMDNPFYIDLVFMGYPAKFSWNFNPDFRQLYYGKPATNIDSVLLKPFRVQNVDEIISELRSNARNEITRKSLNLYIMRFDQLPDPKLTKSKIIEGKPLDKIQFVEDKSITNAQRKLYVKKEQLGPWTTQASGLAQFSENTVSSNWYQGGNNNVAILGILTGRLNYDNKKNVQWENYGEWRMGFNSVEGDTLRMFSTNNDLFKINSKLGIKAGGKFFYSSSVDFSTQFFNSYKGINSTVLKTTFLTPVRLNVGVGLDYKYNKILSLMVSPVSYKYIYLSDTLRVNPNLFGIEKGKNSLSEIGSSFRAEFSYPVTHEIQVDSRLSFYTNYKKVEVDWEIVANMAINRFLSTRISINPRFDNTAIQAKGDEKNPFQFKQFISVGFSHKFK